MPAEGHALRLAGVHFDAVRVRGCRGEEIMGALLDGQGRAIGPVVHLALSNEVTFILPVGTAHVYAWPIGPDIEVMVRSPRRRHYIGIPALTGSTWPLLWRSVPTTRAPFVDAAALHATTVGFFSGSRP